MVRWILLTVLKTEFYKVYINVSVKENQFKDNFCQMKLSILVFYIGVMFFFLGYIGTLPKLINHLDDNTLSAQSYTYVLSLSITHKESKF